MKIITIIEHFIDGCFAEPSVCIVSCNPMTWALLLSPFYSEDIAVDKASDLPQITQLVGGSFEI